jgi:hypothetical protein
MDQKKKVIAAKVSDAWPPEMAQLAGLIAIAFAQLEGVIFRAAKRKADTPWEEWENSTTSDKFGLWCDDLLQQYPEDKKLVTLVREALCVADGRHDVIHAHWAKHPDGYVGRWRRDINLGIEPGPLLDLLLRIRQIRDRLNLHTQGKKHRRVRARVNSTALRLSGRAAYSQSFQAALKTSHVHHTPLDRFSACIDGASAVRIRLKP